MVTLCSLSSLFSFGNNPGGLKRLLSTGLVGETRVKSLLFKNLEDVSEGNQQDLRGSSKLRGKMDAAHKRLGGL